jgi:3-oxosteroid 1-dehydrogenase
LSSSEQFGTTRSAGNGAVQAGRLPLQHVTANETFDLEADVVVVGSGAAGYAAAVTAAGRDASVIILEKADQVGGTTRKSGAWTWIPNNRFLREAGIEDPREDALRYMARLARPDMYDPDSRCFGMPEEDFALLEAFYDHGAEAMESLEEAGALRFHHAAEVPDYYAQLEEDKTPTGRVVMPLGADGPAEGEEFITQLATRAEALGVDVHCGHRVSGVLLNDASAVVGVTATTAEGDVRVHARRGVVFASGGFGQNPDMRRAYCAGPILGSCSVKSNTGDFIPIASALGAPLYNMNYPWLGPIALEVGLRNREDTYLMFEPAGDSMLMVNRYGQRFVDEKIQYNEITLTMWNWNPARAEYPNLFPIMIWDQACQDQWEGTQWGNPIAPPGVDDAHVVHGDTLAELAVAVRERLHQLREHTGGYTLNEGFDEALAATVSRFNEHASRGQDPDFDRGASPISQFFHAALGPPRGGHDGSPLLHALSEEGPYHATIIAPGTHDTKGGPRTNANAEVLDATGTPIPGLYGAGNCVASVSGKAYFAGGATIGPALTFGYLAALAVVESRTAIWPPPEGPGANVHQRSAATSSR